MKEVRIILEDKEHEVLTNLKQALNIKSWRHLLLAGATCLGLKEKKK